MKFKNIKRTFKKNPFLLPITVFGIIIVILLAFLITPSIIQYITYEGDSGGGSSDDDTTIWNFVGGDSIWNEIVGEYEEIIYVHQDGDNSTAGASWSEAYTDLPSAIQRAAATPFWTTLILVGAGTWDVLQPVAQIINRNLIIVGAGIDSTIFINTHPTARAIFIVENDFSGYKFTIRYADTCDGIIAEDNILGGLFDPDLDLYDIRFETNVSNNGNPDALALGTSDHGKFLNLHFMGFCHGNPTAINISNSFHNSFNNIKIEDFTTGIHINLNTSDQNYFHEIEIFNASIGLDIDAGNNQHFHHFTFEAVVIPIDDEVGDSYWFDVWTDVMLGTIQPQNLVGVDVDTNAVAALYGVDVLVLDALAFDRPYYITAILFEPDANERYRLRLWDTFTGTYFYETVIEAKFAGQVDRWTLELPRIFNAHNRIFCSIMSETGNDQMLIWIEMVAI